jgi:glycosyltransferase involved in cell wall biosynthesis
MTAQAVNPRVSIIIPCYRQAQFLDEAVCSALGQSYQPVEVLVVNDGSDDDTEAVAARFGDRIHYLYQSNRGLPAARNTGIAQATGTWLKFLDADDRLHPDQVAWHMESLAGRTDAVSMTGVRFFREDDPQQFEDHAPAADALIPFLLAENDQWIPPLGYLVPAELTKAVGCFDPALTCLEDWDFFSRVGLLDPPLVVDRRIGAYYRLRRGSMSANRPNMAATRARLVIGLHDLLREHDGGRWFGRDLLESEQLSYQQLVALGIEDRGLLAALLGRIQELQHREGFGMFGWRFRLMARLLGYARAERVRAGAVRLLGIRPPECLDTGSWREVPR